MELNKTLAIAALAGVMSLTGFAAHAEEAAAPAESNGCTGKDKEANSCTGKDKEANSCTGKDKEEKNSCTGKDGK